MIIEPLEFNPKELSIADIRTLAEGEIARVTGIPAHVLALGYEASRPKVEHDLSVRCKPSPKGCDTASHGTKLTDTR